LAPAKDENSALTKGTLIPIGLGVSVLIAVVAVVMHFTGHERDIERQLLEIRHDIKMLSRDVEDGMGKRWTRDDQEQWATILGAKNESLEVPEVD
jgi:ABC-type lipoprotein release transport system permease subunit